MNIKHIAISLMFALLTVSVNAVVEDFEDAEQLRRYQQLSTDLRCPKCQNQNLIDSNSQIAEDLRAEVARLVKEGLTDQEIKEYMTSIYGDFVLYEPPVQANTIVLWIGPALMFSIAAAIFGTVLYRRSKLADDEEDGEMNSEDESGAVFDENASAQSSSPESEEETPTTQNPA